MLSELKLDDLHLRSLKSSSLNKNTKYYQSNNAIASEIFVLLARFYDIDGFMCI